MNETIFSLHRGNAPLLVSLPHVGTVIPEDQSARYVERALAVEDTDWHLDVLYGFVRELGASLIVPRHSRYVIDLNRPPEDAPMYAGVNNTELCPTRFFTGEALYRPGLAPDATEIVRRREAFGGRTTTHWTLSWPGSRWRTGMRSCSTGTASSPNCRGCSTAGCRT